MRIQIPLVPKVRADGPIQLEDLRFMDDLRHGDPVGIAVNGVLFFHDHAKLANNGTVVRRRLSLNVDNCGGHGDDSHRYHYHSIPICLLESMGAYVPRQGIAYLGELSMESQIAHWPSRANPSPVLGVALDGFPIMGPYNARGDLQLGSSAGLNATLDECNFDSATMRYHLTPNPPYVPPCWVGERGSYEAKMFAKQCPRAGLTNSFCDGPGCQLSRAGQTCPAAKDHTTVIFTVLAIVSTVVLVALALKNFLRLQRTLLDSKGREDASALEYSLPAVVLSPSILAVSSMLPSVAMLVYGEQLIVGFYRQKLDTQIADWLNTAVNSFMAVMGIVYGLIVAQLMSSTTARMESIREEFAKELSGIQRIVLLMASATKSGGHSNRMKNTAYELMITFVSRMEQVFDTPGSYSCLKSLDHINNLVPVLTSILNHEQGPSVQSLRAIDTVDDVVSQVSSARYSRVLAEMSHMSVAMWVVHHFLASSMFFGVLLIKSYSDVLDIVFCFVAVVLIGTLTYVIADMDSPYRNKINPKAMVFIKRLLLECARKNSTLSEVNSEIFQKFSRSAKDMLSTAIALRTLASRRRMRFEMVSAAVGPNISEGDSTGALPPAAQQGSGRLEEA